jgi:hypothetical protein
MQPQRWEGTSVDAPCTSNAETPAGVTPEDGHLRRAAGEVNPEEIRATYVERAWNRTEEFTLC